MKYDAIVALARRELRDALRNRWFVTYAGTFVALSVMLAVLVLTSAGYGGVSGFGRTAAGLVNLMLFLAPLMGLTLGAQALAAERERGTLEYLLALPLSAADIFLGKFAGQALALAAAIATGFGLSMLVIAQAGVSQGAAAFAGLTGVTVLLAWVSLALGFVISGRSRRTASALGAAVVVWLALVLVGDLGLMGTAVVLKLTPGMLLSAALLNPLESYRILAIYLLTDSLELLGPAGLAARDTFGNWTAVALASILLGWLLASLAVAYRLLVHEVRL